MKIRKETFFRSAIAVLALCVAGAATSVSAQNLLENPGFETGDLTAWEVFGEGDNATVTVQSGDNGPSEPGEYNAFMDNRELALGLTLKQSTAAGTAFPGPVTYAFDLKLDQAEVGGVFFVEIFAEQAGGGVIGGSGLLGPFSPQEWTQFEDSFVAPDGTDFLTIQFVATTGGGEGSVCSMHVDNAFLGQEPVPVESATWGGIKSLYR